MIGHAKRLAIPPGQATGNYQKRVDTVLGSRPASSNQTREVEVPLYDKHKGNCVSMFIPCGSPITNLRDEIADASEPLERKQILTPNARRNPVIQCATVIDVILHCLLYLDGVPYSLRRVGYDSVLVIWLVNKVTQTRYLLCIVRKTTMCRCGCKGWCTLAAFFFSYATNLSNWRAAFTTPHATMPENGSRATTIVAHVVANLSVSKLSSNWSRAICPK
jgi:hypothetical protein